jgi:hypothetical protein
MGKTYPVIKQGGNIMGSKHIAELLIEASKTILQIIDKLENEHSSTTDQQHWIDDLNMIIRQLDHVVEALEKSKRKN